MPLDTLRSKAELAIGKPHGTRMKYVGGCKCLKCRMANSNYETGRARRRLAGDGNGIVDASIARAHILRLSKQKVGYKMIGSLTGVACSILWGIREGKRPRCRAATVRKILAVTAANAGDAILVDAATSWTKIRKLQKEGYTRRTIARMLGSKAKVPALQLNKKKITVKSRARVEALYRKLMT